MHRRKFLLGLAALPMAAIAAPLVVFAEPVASSVVEVIPPSGVNAYKLYAAPHGFTMLELIDLVSKGCGGGHIAERGFGWYEIEVNDSNSVKWLNEVLYYRRPLGVIMEVSAAKGLRELDGFVTMTYKVDEAKMQGRWFDKEPGYEKG